MRADAGRLDPVVDEVFSLGDAKRGFDRLESGEGSGKTVFRIG